MKIKVLVTGGTIAKRYDALSGELCFDAMHLKKMLEQGRSDLPMQIEEVMLKDSLEMDETDRDLIVKLAKNSEESHLLITHGTDTMELTAKRLLEVKEKCIVLVGAMVPYAFKESDALFNIGCALGALQSLPMGVYVVMNGKIFDAKEVKKDKSLGRFVSI